jgi:hypothetical protein
MCVVLLWIYFFLFPSFFLFLSLTLSIDATLLSFVRVSHSTTTHQTLGPWGPYPSPPFAPFWFVLLVVIPLISVLFTLTLLFSLVPQAWDESVCRCLQASCGARAWNRPPTHPPHWIEPYFCALTPLFSVYSGRSSRTFLRAFWPSSRKRPKIGRHCLSALLISLV